MIKFLLSKSTAKQQHIYERLFERHQAHHKALHWSAPESQTVRFEQFLKAGKLQGAKILDLGCGLGDFYGFLRDRGIEVDYTGYDIVPGFVRSARTRFPSARFEERNILIRPSSERFDYIFASGLFAFGSPLFFKEMSRAAYRMCDLAWVFNLYLPSGHDGRFLNLSISEAKRFCQSLEPAQTIVNQSYLDDDITFCLYKK